MVVLNDLVHQRRKNNVRLLVAGVNANAYKEECGDSLSLTLTMPRCEKVAPARPSRHTRVLVVDARLDGHVEGQAVGRHAGCSVKEGNGVVGTVARGDGASLYPNTGNISISERVSGSKSTRKRFVHLAPTIIPVLTHQVHLARQVLPHQRVALVGPVGETVKRGLCPLGRGSAGVNLLCTADVVGDDI